MVRLKATTFTVALSLCCRCYRCSLRKGRTRVITRHRKQIR